MLDLSLWCSLVPLLFDHFPLVSSAPPLLPFSPSRCAVKNLYCFLSLFPSSTLFLSLARRCCWFASTQFTSIHGRGLSVNQPADCDRLSALLFGSSWERSEGDFLPVLKRMTGRWSPFEFQWHTCVRLSSSAPSSSLWPLVWEPMGWYTANGSLSLALKQP